MPCPLICVGAGFKPARQRGKDLNFINEIAMAQMGSLPLSG